MPSFLPYGCQAIDEEDKKAVFEALSQDVITRGKLVSEFEEAVKDYTGAPYAVAFSSATAGLHAACFAAKASEYAHVVTTPITFASTATSALRYRSPITFSDIDPATANFSVEGALPLSDTHSTRGKKIYIPVHFAGAPIDMARFESKIEDPETVIIEDAAHALGASYPTGEKVGACTYCDMTVFSFHPLKSITSGEGGIVTASSSEYAERLRLFRDNGIIRDPKKMEQGSFGPWYYEVAELGQNAHMTEMQAALGISQLKKLDAFVAKRRELAACYAEALKDVEEIAFLSREKEEYSAHHLFVAQIDFENLKTTRKEVMEALLEEGIGTQVHYIPLYRFPLFKKYQNFNPENYPCAEAYYQKALTLPLHVKMGEKEVGRVVAALKNCLSA